ncbi:profilin [Streptomyces uncialis]|uniref:Profilin n=1 Tax=Streptomyces uncialis TaxID=1048205 RepID=A0A1Q4V7J8_9ACTN|nr:profilin [Streptomyces uncialis]MCX4661556.1 profilin [Streptomyces uncialis]OKH93806.1 hypothetical protein AB852_13845 [Streptomyces uncialis]WTE08834.1 profilin [Streptomyces uncialis]
MSWQSYVDNDLVGSGRVQAAAIIDAANGNTRATTAGLLKPGEGAAIVALFRKPADVFAKGVTVSGVKYMGIKGDSRSVYGKKGATGVVLVKTNQSILIGRYNETQQPGDAALVVEQLADRLIEQGD